MSINGGRLQNLEAQSPFLRRGGASQQLMHCSSRLVTHGISSRTARYSSACGVLLAVSGSRHRAWRRVAFSRRIGRRGIAITPVSLPPHRCSAISDVPSDQIAYILRDSERSRSSYRNRSRQRRLDRSGRTSKTAAGHHVRGGSGEADMTMQALENPEQKVSS